MKEMKDNFSEKINYLENIISNQKNEINELKKWKENYDNEIRQIIKNKKDKESLKNIDSNIIKKKEEIDFVEKRLKKNDPLLKQRKIKYILLYRATRDGNSADSFHKKCDNISGTLIVIKTNKGMRFGGYNEKTWNAYNNEEKKKDQNNNGFCYSLDLFKIYNNTKEAESTIKCYTKYGPEFYGGAHYMFDTVFPIEKDNFLLIILILINLLENLKKIMK